MSPVFAYYTPNEKPPSFRVRTNFFPYIGAAPSYSALECTLCSKKFPVTHDQSQQRQVADLAWDHYWTQHEPPICIGEYAQ